MNRFAPNGTAEQLAARDVYGVFSTLFRDSYYHAQIGAVDDARLQQIVSIFGAPWSDSSPMVTIAKAEKPRFIGETEDMIPAHNECAYMPSPPRLLALYCVENASNDGAFFTVAPGDLTGQIGAEYGPSLLRARFACQMAAEVPAFETNLVRETAIGRRLIFTSVKAMTGQSVYRLTMPVDAYSQKVVERIHTVLNDPRNRRRHIWKAGDLLVIDNLRLMHGREAFSGGKRVLRHLRLA